MQPVVDGPRVGVVTSAQVVDLLQKSASTTIGAGLELVDLAGNVLEDLSGDLAGGGITRNSYADLHASAHFDLSRQLAWGADLVRPYVTVADNASTARFNLGVYHLSTPNRPRGSDITTYSVDGYDLLLRLNQPVGDAFSVAAGTSYLTAIKGILAQLGYVLVIVDPAAADKVLPTPRAWVFDDQVTWLRIVNELLASIGYAGIWSDWNGYLRCHPYVLPQDRAIEWTYTDDVASTMLAAGGEIIEDYFTAPNRWVVFRSNVADDVAPVEGAGIYTYVNETIGKTSVAERGGLVITKVIGVDAADQPSLIAAANQIIQQDTSIPEVWNISTALNPLHWHFDRIYVKDAYGIVDAQVTSWSYKFAPDISDMEQEWRVIAR